MNKQIREEKSVGKNKKMSSSCHVKAKESKSPEVISEFDLLQHTSTKH